MIKILLLMGFLLVTPSSYTYSSDTAFKDNGVDLTISTNAPSSVTEKAEIGVDIYKKLPGGGTYERRKLTMRHVRANGKSSFSLDNLEACTWVSAYVNWVKAGTENTQLKSDTVEEKHYDGLED